MFAASELRQRPPHQSRAAWQSGLAQACGLLGHARQGWGGLVAQPLAQPDGQQVQAGIGQRLQRAAFRAALPADRYEIVPWIELADFYNKTVELFGTQVNAVLLLIAVIVVLSISNTLSMAVIERTTEIGTSMALGVRRLGILGLFVWEGVVLGVVAGVLGVGIALALGELISFVGIPMPPPPGMSRGYTGRIDISAALALQGFLLAFLTTVIASILPAWKASRMNIVDALRHQA